MSILADQPTERHGAEPGAAALTVGDWALDTATGQISRGDQRVQLEPKAAEVLIYLAQRPGQVVSRQELEANVWNGRVVSYDAVTNAIIKLRKAFGDDARDPRIIQTLSKRGYRLVAPVQPVAPPAVDDLPPRPQTMSSTSRPRRWWTVLAAASLGLALLVLLLPDGVRRPPDIRPAGPVASTRIVVLPFDNLSDDSSEEYFSLGIAQDLITELARSPHLSVIAANSAFAYRGDESLARLREELGVDYVVRGSVRRDAGRVRINAQLIDAAGGRHLWAERYEEKLEDTFAVQDAIVDRIAASLAVSVRHGEPGTLSKRYAASIEAYDHFLQGRSEYGRRALEDLESAKASFHRAIDLDPQFARAYANLALTHLRIYTDAWSDTPTDALQQARELAQHATRLDDGLPEAHFVNAWLALFERRYQRAIEELDRAIALRPSYADAYAALAWVLHFAGRPEEAEKHLATAVLLSPHMTASYMLIGGGIAFTLGRTEEAIATLHEALDISPGNPRLHLWLAAAYARHGNLEEARWVIQQLLLLHPSIALSRLNDVFPFKDPALLEALKASLRAAGLPE